MFKQLKKRKRGVALVFLSALLLAAPPGWAQSAGHTSYDGRLGQRTPASPGTESPNTFSGARNRLCVEFQDFLNDPGSKLEACTDLYSSFNTVCGGIDVSSLNASDLGQRQRESARMKIEIVGGLWKLYGHL